MQAKLRRKLSVFNGARHGFSLIEVLVVLAILVILFGLLFAPMMMGMDMAGSGRSQARLQDTIRVAAEQMRRELANAVYVYPPPTYPTLSGPVTDYSQLVFVPAAVDAAGRPLTPNQPRTYPGTSGTSQYLVTRAFLPPPGPGPQPPQPRHGTCRVRTRWHHRRVCDRARDVREHHHSLRGV